MKDIYRTKDTEYSAKERDGADTFLADIFGYGIGIKVRKIETSALENELSEQNTSTDS